MMMAMAWWLSDHDVMMIMLMIMSIVILIVAERMRHSAGRIALLLTDLLIVQL